MGCDNMFNEYFSSSYDLCINNEKIETSLLVLRFAVENKIPIYVFGNGGSAYTANHFAQDLVKACGTPATSLSENIGLILAVSNDICFEDIFEFQLKSQVLPGIVVAISCSGNSKNVIKAVRYAKENNMPVITLTSFSGGELAEISDLDIHIPTDNIFVAESFHSVILHYFIDCLRKG